MTPEEKLAIARQSTNTLLPHLYRHTVTVIDTNDNEGDPGKWGIFSGTLVEVGDKLFVATASHCLEDLSSPTRYWILGDSPRFKSDGIPEVIATHGLPGNRPDVGIMELEKR